MDEQEIESSAPTISTEEREKAKAQLEKDRLEGRISTGESLKWVRDNYDTLLKEYRGKTIIVQRDKVIAVFDDAVDPIKLTKYVRDNKITGDWTYEHVSDDLCCFLELFD